MNANAIRYGVSRPPLADTSSVPESPSARPTDRWLSEAPSASPSSAADAPELLQRAVQASNAPERAEECRLYLTTRPELLARSAPLDVATLVWAAGTNRDNPLSEGLVQPLHAARALETLAALSPQRRRSVDAILGASGTVARRAVLLKELGAHHPNSDELLQDLTELAELIAHRPLEWLVRNATSYGVEQPGSPRAMLDRIRRRLPNRGPALAQTFVSSCGPAVRLVVAAEVSPLVALRAQLDTNHGPARRSYSGRDQKRVLQKEGATAIPLPLAARISTGTLFSRGKPTFLDNYIDSAVRGLNLDYKVAMWASKGQVERRRDLDALERLVRLGADLPLETSAPDGPRHYRAVVDVYRDEQGRRVWRIYDPDPEITTPIERGDEYLLYGAGDHLEVEEIWVPVAAQPGDGAEG